MATNKKYELNPGYTFKLGKRQVFNTKQKIYWQSQILISKTLIKCPLSPTNK